MTWTVALTGATGDFASLLLPALQADPRVTRILTFGPRPSSGSKIEFHRLDLTRPDAELELAAAMTSAGTTALYHLALLLSPVRDPVFAHELEVAGTQRVLAAAALAHVKRVIVPSFTAVYGASPHHPALLRESTAPIGCPGSRFVSDKLEIEHAVQAFTERAPRTQVLLLRFAPPLGPSLDNPITRLLRRRFVPTLLGFDPRWQAVHADDAGVALHLALDTRARGTFNIVGRGVIPFSDLVHAAGSQPVPLPASMARGALATLRAAGGLAVPLPLLDYLRHGWVADGSRAEEALGFRPRHHVRDAASSLRGVSAAA